MVSVAKSERSRTHIRTSKTGDSYEQKGKAKGNGEGAIYQRKSDGKWCAAITTTAGKRKVLYGKTRQDVAAKLAAALRNVQQGIPLGDERLTVGKWLDYWLAEIVQPEAEPTTYEGYEISVRLHIKPVLGRVKVRELQVEHVDGWLDDMKRRGVGLRTRQFALARLRTALTHAMRRGHVARNVAQLGTMPKSQKKPIQAPAGDQVQRLMAAIQHDRQQALVTVALALGLRRGETLGLHWEDIDLDARTLTVRRKVNRVQKLGLLVRDGAKTRAGERTIPLPHATVAALRAHRVRQLEDRMAAGDRWKGPDYPSGKMTGFVFTSEVGTVLEPRNVSRYFAGVCKRAGLDAHTFHTLRHDCASLLLAQGVPLWAVSKILGHSGVQVTANIYGHLAQEMHRDAMDRMDALLGWPVEAAV